MAAIALLIATASALSGPVSAQVPAQVRVAFDARRILAVEARGDADRATGRRVTGDDPVRIASISKLVTALGVMRLVEAGTLDLDRDVSDMLGWRLRNPAFPDVPITLRLLLSHRSSLRDDVDYVVPLGKKLRDVLADPKAWDASHAPGRWFRYTNLNFPLVASVMEAASGERFDRLMARTVFTPLKIDACFNWTTCSEAKIARAVVLYDADGSVRRDDLHGQRPACPVLATGPCDIITYRPGDNGALFSPQGGVRISMRDLARIGQMLLNKGGRFLSPSSVKALRGPEWIMAPDSGDDEAGFYCQYGLAVQSLGMKDINCRDDLFGDGRPRFGHVGEAYGLRSGLWIDPANGRGVAYFTTAVPDDAPPGDSAFTRAEEAVARRRR